MTYSLNTIDDVAAALDDGDYMDPFKFATLHAAPSGSGVVPGVDYAWTKPSINSLKGAGEVFVAQYFSNDPTKNLTPARAHDLQTAGIELVVVWEYDAQAMLGGLVQGQRDASDAETQAKACGVDGIPIYFAADWDATPGQQASINAYLDGCASVIGHSRVGMYGGFWPVSRAKAAGKTSYIWGTPAWSGSNWSTLTPDIMQGGFVTIGGVQCDLDAALHADFGQWPRPATGPTFTWQWWTSDGNLSLAGISRQLAAKGAPGMSPAHILRATCMKDAGHWDAEMFSWLNYVLGDPIENPHHPIPAGSRLWVLND